MIHYTDCNKLSIKYLKLSVFSSSYIKANTSTYTFLGVEVWIPLKCLKCVSARVCERLCTFHYLSWIYYIMESAFLFIAQYLLFEKMSYWCSCCVVAVPVWKQTLIATFFNFWIIWVHTWTQQYFGNTLKKVK